MKKIISNSENTSLIIPQADLLYIKSLYNTPAKIAKMKYFIALPLMQPALRILQEQNYTAVMTRNVVLNAVSWGAIQYKIYPEGWTREQWATVQNKFGSGYRTVLMTVAARGYGVLPELNPNVTNLANRALLARRIFGNENIEHEISRVRDSLKRLGFKSDSASRIDQLRRGIADILLCHSSSNLDVITNATLNEYANALVSPTSARVVSTISSALVELGITSVKYTRNRKSQKPLTIAPTNVHSEWLSWGRRWQETSPLSDRSRRGICDGLVTAGRWLSTYHPDVVSPKQWNFDLAIEYVNYISKMKVGDLTGTSCRHISTGKKLTPYSQISILSAIRRAFHDFQMWGWIEINFKLDKAFVVPKQIYRSTELNPRPIDDGFWLKLRTAALSLTVEDLSITWKTISRSWFPMELVRAVAVAWLFSGCRSDEVERFEVGCVYLDHTMATNDGSEDLQDQVVEQAMLRVPVSKTRGEFVKPVERPLWEAISAWEAIRPQQPSMEDRTTKRMTHPLFANRGRRISTNFINKIVIPVLLKKAGLPPEDSRGKITSHRARATMATLLYSHESGMGSVEVMNWLGHKNLSSTQYYLEITPTKLMKAFHKRGEISEKLRYISVLVDPKAEVGSPSIMYDLGHGWCTNDAYASCKHRMACARCDFYLPSEEAKGLFERQGKQYIKMLQELELTEVEKAVISGDALAVSNLISGLEGLSVSVDKILDPNQAEKT